MLVVSAQIWPGGDEGQAYLVGEIIAANESGLSRVSSYSVSISQGPAPKIGIGAGSANSPLKTIAALKVCGRWLRPSYLPSTVPDLG